MPGMWAQLQAHSSESDKGWEPICELPFQAFQAPASVPARTMRGGFHYSQAGICPFQGKRPGFSWDREEIEAQPSLWAAVFPNQHPHTRGGHKAPTPS